MQILSFDQPISRFWSIMPLINLEILNISGIYRGINDNKPHLDIVAKT